MLARIRRFFLGGAVASKYMASSSAPPPQHIKVLVQPAPAPVPSKVDPASAAVAKFESFFPDGIPSLTDVLAKRLTHPDAFDACRQLLADTIFLVALDCLAALDDLRSNPTLEKAREIRDKFSQNPMDDPVEGNSSGSDKLNLYYDSQKNFAEKFNAAEKALQETDDNKGRQQLLQAFDDGIGPTLAYDRRCFNQNVSSILDRHRPRQQAGSLRPEPGRLA